jgi:FtsP/CotA-like multicopper oxidase with cupredoxin domain
VINLQTNDETRLFMRFRDMKGRYVMHCHNVVHEDRAMMVRWDIVSGYWDRPRPVQAKTPPI